MVIGMAPWAEAAKRLKGFVTGTFSYFDYLAVGRDIVAVERGIANPTLLGRVWAPVFKEALIRQGALARERDAVLAKIREGREKSIVRGRELAAGKK